MTILIVIGIVAALVLLALRAEQRGEKSSIARRDPIVVKRYTSSFIAQDDIRKMAQIGYRVSSQAPAKVWGQRHGVMVTYERIGSG